MRAAVRTSTRRDILEIMSDFIGPDGFDPLTILGIVIGLIEFIINLIMFGVIQHECNTTYWAAWTSKQQPSDDTTANTLIWVSVSLAFVGGFVGGAEKSAVPCGILFMVLSSVLYIIGFILTCVDIHNKC